jgi:dTDP-4-amino-4,6-dideoxygalactose transaminase
LIPLFNPSLEFDICGTPGFETFTRVGESGMYVSGVECVRFEIELAQRLQIPFAIGVSSGTMALELLLRADGVGRGDKVVTSAHTFVAVVEAILSTGAEPMFVDIDPDTWQMPPGNWPDAVVMVCHLYGGASAAVRSTARLLYEDASQSFGGSLEGRRLGTLTRAGAISLYPTKNLSAMGDAGVVITSDEDLACRLRALRNHGQTAAQVHEYRGTTGRLDEIQAAILCEKLKRFDSFLKARREAARYYLEHLQDLPLGFPQDLPQSNSAPNLFVVRTEARDRLKKFLASQEITTGIHYPTPLHLMPAYRDQPWAQVSLPETERLCAEILSLPLWVGISPQQQARVVETIRKFFGADGRKL